jgi:predicted nucleic acid-binding protein
LSVLVDTSIWSLALRRRRGDLHPEESVLVKRWEGLVRKGQAVIIGPIRQEILSGLRSTEQFERLRERLDPFDDLPILQSDYEEAARLFNRLRSRGITGTPTDLLICAVAQRLGTSIFTTDEDFRAYARHLTIRILG